MTECEDASNALPVEATFDPGAWRKAATPAELAEARRVYGPDDPHSCRDAEPTDGNSFSQGHAPHATELNSKSTSNRLLWSIGSIVTLGLFSLIVTSKPALFAKKQDGVDAAPMRDMGPADYEVTEQAEAAIRSVLKDPESARFTDVHVRRLPGKTPLACGYVNAKNGFGGYMGAEPFISNGQPGRTTVIASQILPSTFAGAWNKLCVSRPAGDLSDQ